MDPSNQLQIEARADGRAVVIAFAGELDLASASAAQAELDRVAGSDVERVIADLSGLTFMDSTGLAILVKASRAAKESAHRFVVIKGGPQVERLFALTGMDEELELVESPEDFDLPQPTQSS
jgi:anti-anti-sigma factor